MSTAQTRESGRKCNKPPWSGGLFVVETGVDPVTLRFSGVCSAD